MKRLWEMYFADFLTDGDKEEDDDFELATYHSRGRF
jgi:hypothetical protein